MDFTVLLSLYHKENPSNLKDCLISIFSQTLPPSEVVIVKDGPLGKELEDILLDFSLRYPIIRIIPLNKNQGLGKALNIGLQHCSNNLVARMDTDDISKKYRFEKQVAVFRLHPETDICSAWIDEFESNIGSVISVRRLPEYHLDIYKYAKSRNPINHPVVMFKKDVVLQAGGYQHFPLFEDYYLWVRMLLNQARFYNIQESLLYFRTSPEMFKRRGGFKYAINEFKLFHLFYSLGFINFFTFVKNIAIRFVARIVPNNIRSFIYKNIIR